MDSEMLLRVFVDGNQWCAVYHEDFINLQESPAGFGNSVAGAVADLMFQTSGVGPGGRPFSIK